jgi:cobalt-zinc-cadmium efflux system protein
MGTNHHHDEHGQQHVHSHIPQGEGNERALLIALGLTTVFLIAEIAGGILTNSLALLSDAAHMFTDTAALVIALMAIRIGKRPADKLRTYGYNRFEILAAAANAILLFGVGIYILFEAYERLKNPPDIQSTGMLFIAALGLVVNLISMRVLSGGKNNSMNMKGAYLEVWSDMLGSLGVIVGAAIIAYTNWTWVDSAVAVGIGLWVLPRTWMLLKGSINVLLEGVPEGLALSELESALTAVPGVKSVHDLHVWAVTTGKASITAHVVAGTGAEQYPQLLIEIREMLATKFDLHHSTVQIEATPCEQERDIHSFLGEQDHQ